MTMRADFMGQALTYRPLADTLQTSNLLLGPMNQKELKDAIVQPAKKRIAAIAQINPKIIILLSMH